MFGCFRQGKRQKARSSEITDTQIACAVLQAKCGLRDDDIVRGKGWFIGVDFSNEPCESVIFDTTVEKIGAAVDKERQGVKCEVSTIKPQGWHQLKAGIENDRVYIPKTDRNELEIINYLWNHAIAHQRICRMLGIPDDIFINIKVYGWINNGMTVDELAAG